MTFEAMWAELAPIGRSSTGGYLRQPLTGAEREAAAWFVAQAQARGLAVESDGYGNLLARWSPPGSEGSEAPGETVLTGSHLDSVRHGGAFDGPLGVVSAYAAIDLLRDRGYVPSRPIAVAAFCEEEGSRFGVACLGSRLATGLTAPHEGLARADADGVRFDTALEAAGIDPGTGSRLLDGVGCYVELHVEQGRDLVHRDEPVAAARMIWPHGRYRFDFTGRADHAGTTAMADRADPMLTYAMTVLAANKQARTSGQRATFGRVEVAPNSTNAITSRVTAWLDARAESETQLNELLAAIEKQAADRAARDGTELLLTPESVSGAVGFDVDLTRRITEGTEWPLLATQAGHDAGVLAAAGIPSAMLFVRNPTGVSHSPDEHAETADCLAGVVALADTLERLAG